MDAWRRVRPRTSSSRRATSPIPPCGPTRRPSQSYGLFGSLVLGNQDVADRERERLRGAGSVEKHATVLLAMHLPLALKHLPLCRVSPTAVNVHAHLHGRPGPDGPYVHLSEEKAGYVPLRLDDAFKEGMQTR